MSDIAIIKWANNLGITESLNGSWIEAIARHYGEGGGEPHIRSIANNLGITEPTNGSWIQAIGEHLGATAGTPWITQISNLTAGGSTSEFFEITVDTTKPGSASDTFVFAFGNTGTYNAVIDWGDGTTSDITSYNDADRVHVYASSGTYQIKISGELPWILFGGGSGVDRQKVMSIDNWGIIPWRSFQYAFSGCINMDILATDIPDLTTNSVSNISQIFRSCSSITSVSLVGWDTSNVTTMALMFQSLTSCTSIDLTGIDTSNVTNFNQTFSNVPDDIVIGLDTWNIEKVTNFGNTFFNSALSTVEYDKTLISWDLQDARDGLNVQFGRSQYTLNSAAATAKQSLMDNDLWTITDGGGI